jgi:hypothetical protein
MEKNGNRTIEEIINNLIDVFYQVSPEAKENISKEEIENTICKYIAGKKKGIDKIELEELRNQFIESYTKGSIFMIDAQLILNRMDGMKYAIKTAGPRSTSTKH